MSTGLVEKWNTMDLANFGAVYPMVEITELWYVLCILAWLGWHVWQAFNERRTYDHDREVLKDPETLRWALHRDTIEGAENGAEGRESQNSPGA